MNTHLNHRSNMHPPGICSPSLTITHTQALAKNLIYLVCKHLIYTLAKGLETTMSRGKCVQDMETVMSLSHYSPFFDLACVPADIIK